MGEGADFDLSVLQQLGAPVKHFEAGEKVFLEHDSGDVMYLVSKGRVDVIHYGTVLDNVRAGGIVGEMALIDGDERSAAAIAAEPSEVIAIDRPTFLAMIAQQPEFALRVMSILARRIRRMNRQI